MPIPGIYIPPPGAICEAKWKEGKAQTTQTTLFKKKGMDPKTRRIAIHSFLVLNSRRISVRDAASFFSVSKSLMHEIMQEDSAEYLRSHPPPKKPQ